MQAKSRATLSYRPQANGQQERSVKTMIQTVRMYVGDPLQADWNDIAEKLVHPINKSRNSTRKEMPFYLAHGWDAHPTLKAMTESMRLAKPRHNRVVDSTIPHLWRRESNRQREVALRLAKEYQVREKDRRAREHNELLSQSKRRKESPNTAYDTKQEMRRQKMKLLKWVTAEFKARRQRECLMPPLVKETKCG